MQDPNTTTALNFSSKQTFCFISFSFSVNTDDKIGIEGVRFLSEALKSYTTLTSLNLTGNKLVASFHVLHSFSLNKGNDIGSEGVIKLSEALKSITSLTLLDLTGNILVASFILTQ
jgi:Leucine-rich repeat (LRR) protein